MAAKAKKKVGKKRNKKVPVVASTGGANGPLPIVSRYRTLFPELKGKAGQPTKLTPERSRLICAMIRQGSWLEVAAEMNGITRETLRMWQKYGLAALVKQ